MKIVYQAGDKIMCNKCKNMFELGKNLAFYTSDDIPLCTPCANELGL